MSLAGTALVGSRSVNTFFSHSSLFVCQLKLKIRCADGGPFNDEKEGLKTAFALGTVGWANSGKNSNTSQARCHLPHSFEEQIESTDCSFIPIVLPYPYLDTSQAHQTDGQVRRVWRHRPSCSSAQGVPREALGARGRQGRVQETRLDRENCSYPRELSGMSIEVTKLES